MCTDHINILTYFSGMEIVDIIDSNKIFLNVKMKIYYVGCFIVGI